MWREIKVKNTIEQLSKEQHYKSAEFDASLVTKTRIDGMCSITSGLIISNCIDEVNT